MNTIADIAVTDSDIAAFRADGAVVLRGPFAEWVETLRAGVARNIEAPGPDARVYDGSPGKGRHFGDYCNWDRIPEFRRLHLRIAGRAHRRRGSWARAACGCSTSMCW